jgi:hypothetical protein
MSMLMMSVALLSMAAMISLSFMSDALLSVTGMFARTASVISFIF